MAVQWGSDCVPDEIGFSPSVKAPCGSLTAGERFSNKRTQPHMSLNDSAFGYDVQDRHAVSMCLLDIL